RKAVSLSQIYDATAVRILVDTQAQCYEVMDLVHHLWSPVFKEYDDYIVKPKPNGYQSLHTAVEGPEGRVFEVQIRTYKMHDLAEMGVAAHWKYKEGSGTPFKASHERKIEWLRQVLAWHQDMSTHHGETSIDSTFMDDRVYIFTPDGDILDLPVGVTVLDFAYHLHTDVGHRCRGAKVNGTIVPLTYALKTGDKVEILTNKEPKPSRDWINPHLNYLKSSRAKAKVLHWFKVQDFDRNCMEGKEILDKEFKTMGLKSIQLQKILPFHNATTVEELYAALGRGDIKITQIMGRLIPHEKEEAVIFNKPALSTQMSRTKLRIEGVGNLLTHMARCCQPLPGDKVIGYITLGRGVSIHRQDCMNIVRANAKQRERFLEVNWGAQSQEVYHVMICIRSFEHHTLLRDVTAILTQEKAHVLALKNEKDTSKEESVIHMTLEIDSLTTLSRLLNKLEHIPNVLEVRRI
ncbi:MAG TPA: TGS domain-containing protein, partial [Legionellaceae bacterium]|nr:TGS domain-containing protein [Legionellaceae bacterium]